eukprot:CAMPEP_0171067190 /NCGR_PEP_ID=MMETSP0766_2-20121228/7853_1 /TAXON_ID=439317 /ORGANISM="Gambierdiscus australes, Strain CAWD 149" /LENGTH=490 /DNA_ID=CAMNT_0011523409 /DNA_START=83 /DNA_END=1555 /DNA_ORIENTATION=+
MASTSSSAEVAEEVEEEEEGTEVLVQASMMELGVTINNRRSFTVEGSEQDILWSGSQVDAVPAQNEGSTTYSSSKDAHSDTTEQGRGRSLLERTHSSSVLWVAQVGRTVSGTLNRHGVNLNASAVVPTQRCNICLESVPSVHCVVPLDCGREAHCACMQCMSMYVRLRIEEGRVNELWCPCAGNDGCEAKVADSEVESWMSSNIVDKYKRFTRMQADDKLRACPQCNELCLPKLRNPQDKDSAVVPEMECSACGCQFCFYHSNAHAVGPAACAAHEREILKQERQALSKIVTRKCPRCGVITEKSSGCNHMTCQCKCQWCWVCGKEITNVGWHYHPLKPLSCAQYNEKTVQRDHCRLVTLMTLAKILTWPGAVVAAVFLLVCPVVFLLIVLAEVVALCFTCCCCLVCCIFLRDFEVENVVKIVLSLALGFTALIVGLPFGAFCLSWCVLALPLWLLLLPFGAGTDHLAIIASAPVMTVLTSMECFTPELD